MRDPYGEAVATRAGPGPCRCGGNVALEAWAGVRVGWVLSRESILSSGRRPRMVEGKATGCTAGARAATSAPQGVGGTLRRGLRPNPRLQTGRPW